MSTEIIWVPRHKDIISNEMADEAAKAAAKSQGMDPNIPRSIHMPLKSARSVCIKQEVTNSWNDSWQSEAPSNDAKQLREITKKPNISSRKKLYNNITALRRQGTQLARLRTGHCSLNRYLYRFGHAESPQCESNYAIETIEQYLLHYSQYDRQRTKLAREVGVCGMRMEKLLGRPRMI